MEQTRERRGDTMGFRLVTYPDYSVLAYSDLADNRRMPSYT
ncbi:hypothetical protein [Mycobacterium uberis]|nr:hypothetical protein [Mycobacterium uberis]